MKDKELRRLRRSDLIEIIYELQKNDEQLQQEIKNLRSQVSVRKELNDEAGALTDILPHIQDLFLSAQKVADEYMENARAANEEAQRLLASAREQSKLGMDGGAAESEAGNQNGEEMNND